MHAENLLFIKDKNNKKLFYSFTPATVVSNFVPLVVILDEAIKDKIPTFEYKMWNILIPLQLEDTKKDPYWLGRDGDFWIKNLLQKLIYQIAEEYECEDHIYLYGHDMSGYSAILHGILCNANAIYVQNSHIRLEITNRKLKQFSHTHINTTGVKENDLTHFLNPIDHFPLFYLCNNNPIYEKSETAYFIDACKRNNIKFKVNFCPKVENDKTQVLKKVLDFFEKVASGTK